MTLEQLQSIPILQTASISEAAKRDPATHAYIVECLQRFFAGDYGEVPAEDVDANNADLEQGDGHILARYKKAFRLDTDIYIEAHFYYEALDDIDYTNIVIMYPFER